MNKDLNPSTEHPTELTGSGHRFSVDVICLEYGVETKYIGYFDFLLMMWRFDGAEPKQGFKWRNFTFDEMMEIENKKL